MPQYTATADIRRILAQARTIAVLGANDQSWKPAYYVPDYLHAQGYRVIPVNARIAGKTLWGETVLSALDQVQEPVDIVDVFRRSEDIPAHIPEILEMEPRPRLVWFQLGIRNDAAAAKLLEAGLDVVQDRCTLADHRALSIGRVG